MNDLTIRDPSTGETAWLRPLSDDLDLAKLPETLDAATLARVEAIANSPLPELPPCDSATMGQALLMMQATLPRRQADDVTGELFVAAYERQLGGYPSAAIEWLCDKAIATRRWFPTVAECHEMLTEWHRRDADTERKRLATTIFHRHRIREIETPKPPPVFRNLTQADVEMMPEAVREAGLACGALKRDENGELVPA